MNKNNYFMVSIAIIILAIVMVSGCTSSGNSTKDSNSGANSINVQNLAVKSGGYGSYDVTGTITPNKDLSYLEMVAIAYDSSGAIIERSPLVWNINDAKSGQVYKVNGMVYISGNDAPVKMDILIFDSPFSGASEKGNIYKQTVDVS